MRTVTISRNEAQELFETIPENTYTSFDELAEALDNALGDMKITGHQQTIQIVIESEEEESDDE